MSKNLTEVWKTIPGFDADYQVSCFGRVRSLKYGREKILKPNKGGKSKAYKMVPISLANGLRTTTTLQRIVYLAFVGAIPEGLEVDHIDDNPENNTPKNLRTVTRQENMAKSWERRRAIGHTAMHKNGNHCKRGHEYNKENTRLSNDGYRYCRACDSMKAKERYQRRISAHKNLRIKKVAA